MPTPLKILVALSGGVDSAVAAGLLREQGHDVTAVFLCLRRGASAIPGSPRSCCSPQDAEDARVVAETLGIPRMALSVSDRFEPIIDQFVSEYARGRTPNPCVHCNTHVKFGYLLQIALAGGFDRLATGHWARIAEYRARPAIARARNLRKDQSYVLMGLPGEQIGRILFPLGELAGKDEVRAHARRLGLPVHDKPDSQEICFAPPGGYTEMLRDRAPETLKPGSIVDASGRVLGRHEGYARYTIGQRQGLGIAAPAPLYVTRIDPSTNTVVVGYRDAVVATRLAARAARWQHPMPPEFDATVQIRYKHRGAAARVRLLENGEGFEAEFSEPVDAVTPGQAAVVYEGDILLGGGWID